MYDLFEDLQYYLSDLFSILRFSSAFNLLFHHILVELNIQKYYFLLCYMLFKLFSGKVYHNFNRLNQPFLYFNMLLVIFLTFLS